MSNHTNLGDIAIPVGSYESQGATKKRFRNIGTLMETVEDDGRKRRWLRLNLDIFHASLFAMAKSACGAAKGDDSVIATVFEPKDPAKPPAPKADEEGETGPF